MGLKDIAGYISRNCEKRIVNLKQLIQACKTPNPIVVLEDMRIPHLFSTVPYANLFKEVENFKKSIEESGGKILVWATQGDLQDQEATFEKNRGIDYDRTFEERPERFKQCRYADRYAVFHVFDSLKVELRHGTRRELVEFLNNENCVALIAQDADFLIFDLKPKYIPMLTLNLKTLTARECSKIDVMKCFKLRSEQLPLFASLIGGTIVNSSKLHEFHAKLRSIYETGDILYALSKYIGANCVDASKAEYIDERTSNQIDQCIKYYSLGELYIDASGELSEFKVSYKNLPLLSFIDQRNGNTIRIHQDPIHHIISYDENQKSAIKIALLPLRKVLYALLFRDIESITEIYSLDGAGTEVKFNPNKKCIEEIQNLPHVDRYEMLLSAVCPSIMLEEVKQLCPNLVIPFLALAYLKANGALADQYELMYLVATLLHVRDDADTPKYAGKLQERLKPLQMINLFLNACSYISMLNSVLGHVVPNSDHSKVPWSFCKDVALIMSYGNKMLQDASEREEYDFIGMLLTSVR